MSERRLDDLFLAFKVIRRALDAPGDLTAQVLAQTPADRQEATALRDAGDVVALHALCVAVIDQREAVATTLEAIRLAVAVADIVPRTANRGRGARRDRVREN